MSQARIQLPAQQHGEVDNMEKKSLVLNGLLAATLGAGLLVGMIWKAFVPNVVLADLEIPSMAADVIPPA